MSTRLDFKIQDLREQVEARYAATVRKAEEAYVATLDMTARRNEWRAEQETRIKALAEGLPNLPDNALESFRIPKCPREDRYRTPEDERNREIKGAADRRDSALRRIEGLHAPSGAVSLTANMLRDWFGL